MIAGLTIAFMLGIGMELYIASGQARSVFAAVLVPLPVLSCLIAAIMAGKKAGMIEAPALGLPRMQTIARTDPRAAPAFRSARGLR